MTEVSLCSPVPRPDVDIQIELLFLGNMDCQGFYLSDEHFQGGRPVFWCAAACQKYKWYHKNNGLQPAFLTLHSNNHAPFSI